MQLVDDILWLNSAVFVTSCMNNFDVFTGIK